MRYLRVPGPDQIAQITAPALSLSLDLQEARSRRSRSSPRHSGHGGVAASQLELDRLDQLDRLYQLDRKRNERTKRRSFPSRLRPMHACRWDDDDGIDIMKAG